MAVTKKDGKVVPVRAKKPKPMDQPAQSVEDHLLQIARLKAKRNQLDAEIKSHEALALAEMERMNVDVVETDDLKATIVRGQSEAWIEDKVKELLPQSDWVKVSTRKLDPKLLSAAVNAGKIKPSELVEAVEITERAPYIRITNKAKK